MNNDTYLTIDCIQGPGNNDTAKFATVSHTGNYWDSVSISFIDTSGFYFSSGYRTGYNTPGASFIITKFDTTNRIISGTFNCTLYGGNDSAAITDGRFDFKIAPLCKCSR